MVKHSLLLLFVLQSYRADGSGEEHAHKGRRLERRAEAPAEVGVGAPCRPSNPLFGCVRTYCVNVPPAEIVDECPYYSTVMLFPVPGIPIRPRHALDLPRPSNALVRSRPCKVVCPRRNFFCIIQIITLAQHPIDLLRRKDEPTSGLDAHSSLELMNIMKRLSSKVCIQRREIHRSPCASLFFIARSRKRAQHELVCAFSTGVALGRDPNPLCVCLTCTAYPLNHAKCPYHICCEVWVTVCADPGQDRRCAVLCFCRSDKERMSGGWLHMLDGYGRFCT